MPRAQGALDGAVGALPIAAPVGEESGVLTRAALGADEAVGPARLPQRRLALDLGVVIRDKLPVRHTVLELDRILGHDMLLALAGDSQSAPTAGSIRERAS